MTLQLDDYAELLKGNPEKDGEEFIVRTTSGTTMTGSQLVERFAGQGIIVAVSREHGPLDVFRFQRFTTAKQRLALEAENPCCTWEGCKVPFEKCQIHHIKAWARSGPSNILYMDKASPPRCSLCECRGGVLCLGDVVLKLLIGNFNQITKRSFH